LFSSKALPLAGVAAIALPLVYAARGEIGRVALRDAARAVADASGMSLQDALEYLRSTPGVGVETEIGPGVWVSAAGGMLVLVGGILMLLWAVRTKQEPSSPTVVRP
jgi:hypothetical protein